MCAWPYLCNVKIKTSAVIQVDLMDQVRDNNQWRLMSLQRVLKGCMEENERITYIAITVKNTHLQFPGSSESPWSSVPALTYSRMRWIWQHWVWLRSLLCCLSLPFYKSPLSNNAVSLDFCFLLEKVSSGDSSMRALKLVVLNIDQALILCAFQWVLYLHLFLLKYKCGKFIHQLCNIECCYAREFTWIFSFYFPVCILPRVPHTFSCCWHLPYCPLLMSEHSLL